MQYGAVFLWWAAAVAVALAGLPIAATVLRRLPDRGAALSFPLGAIVLTLPVYWIGHLSYGPLTIWAGVVVLIGTAAVLAWRGPVLDLGRFGEALLVFSAAFFLLVAVRAVDPSIHTAGGEKFLDYGLLRTVLRADVLPPEDFWFAGEPLQYYYGGHLMAGILAALTTIRAPFAYNLALPWFYGLLVVAAYGVAGSIAASRGRSYRIAGGAGALFVGFASNLVPAVQALLRPLPDDVAHAVASFLVREDPDAFYQLTAVELSDPESTRTAYYWIPSRVIENTINEFPLFAFLNGDLHAHMMSQPFLLLVVGLAFAYYLAPADAPSERRALVFGAIPPVAGFVGVINTWSFPTAVGVTWLAVLFAPTDPAALLPAALRGRLWTETPAREELSRLVAATAGAVGVSILGLVWALPFFLGPATGGVDRSIGFVVDRSDLVEFALVHGWILLVFGVYLGRRATDRLTTEPSRLGILVALGVVVGLLADAAAFVLVLPLVALAWLLLRRDDAGLGFDSVLFVAGGGIVLLVEVLFLMEGDGGNRMNTVFKSYSQVWVLWATAAAVPFARAFSSRTGPGSRRHRQAASVAAAVLLVSVSIYGGVALADRFADAGEPTLDATTWAREAHAEEWAAIQWLDEEHAGRPTIVSAPGCSCNRNDVTPYRWVNAPSSFTGIPTLAGWGYGSHQSKYRGTDAYMSRVRDVETIYTGPWDQRRALLEQYDVTYVYVGPNERTLYGDPGFADREEFEVEFENSRVTIYRVDYARR